MLSSYLYRKLTVLKTCQIRKGVQPENVDRYDQVPLRLSNLSDQDNIKGDEDSDGDKYIVEC